MEFSYRFGLTPTGAELALLDNVALSANFDGEFSNRANTYAGRGAVKVRW